MVIGAINLINIGLKTWVFTKADMDFYNPRVVCPLTVEGEKIPECDEKEITEEEIQRQKDQATSQRQRQASNAVAMLLVGTPVFLFHFKLARNEK